MNGLLHSLPMVGRAEALPAPPADEAAPDVLPSDVGSEWVAGPSECSLAAGEKPRSSIVERVLLGARLSDVARGERGATIVERSARYPKKRTST
jgi:hypothetical protein